MQGAGNDFVVIETGDEHANWSRLAVAMCDRHFGVGADGLLLLMPSRVADFRMRIFNADGSEANTCGNGIRCLVKYYVDGGHLEATAGKVTLLTAAGAREAWYFRTGGTVSRVKVGMGKPELSGEMLAAARRSGGAIVDITLQSRYKLVLDGTELLLDLVSMGNPHAVYFTEKAVSEFPLSEIGPKVERDQAFPNGVNFEVVRVLGDGQIEARVWEHGVGETLACGSGACAIMVAAHLHGLAGTKAEVRLPGGALEIEWDGSGGVFLSGPAKTVFAGEWTDTDFVVDGTASGNDIKNEVLA